MQDFQRPARGTARARRFLAPALAIAALALTTQAARAIGDAQPKPQLSVETERTMQGAKLTFKGKNWAPNARVKITGTRAPGASSAQDFGMFSADEAGALTGKKTAPCSTSRAEDGQAEQVTITATDSATSVKATARVDGGAWVCM
jgi:hypothetical protein